MIVLRKRPSQFCRSCCGIDGSNGMVVVSPGETNPSCFRFVNCGTSIPLFQASGDEDFQCLDLEGVFLNSSSPEKAKRNT